MGYEKWQYEAESFLEDLVAQNFEEIYNGDPTRHNAWIRISTALYKKYDLDNISENDPKYELKQKKKNYIGTLMGIYILKEFPHELHDPQVYRFVKQYKKLPSQLPNEWQEFEPEIRRKAVKEQEKSLNSLKEMARVYREEYLSPK